jgi:hypothetical protein
MIFPISLSPAAMLTQFACKPGVLEHQWHGSNFQQQLTPAAHASH